MPITSVLQSLLEFPIISQIRRNHGLEHATLHTLSRRFPGLHMAGYSSPGGFWIVGNISTEVVKEAVGEALQRLRAGEHNLAVHPNCGTNFITTGTLAGLTGAAAMFGSGKRFRDKLERLPLAASMATLVLILSQPLGLLVQQRITTSGHPGSLEIVEISRSQRGRMNIHRVVTRG